MISLFCFRNVCKRVPYNYILLLIFTITESYYVSYLTGRVGPYFVLFAGLVTFSIVLICVSFAVLTNKDITKSFMGILYCIVVIIVFSIVGSIY